MNSGDCFDARLASYPTRVLRLAEVVDPLSVTHAPDVIARYADAMRCGARFPPVSVVCLAGRYFIADGHKRFSACRQLGVAELVVEVWPWRRWLRDQSAQLRRSATTQGALLARACVDPVARRAARHQAIVTAGHWRRIATSLRRLTAGRRRRAL